MIRVFALLFLLSVSPNQNVPPRIHSEGKSVICNSNALDVDRGGVAVIIDERNDPSTLVQISSFKGSDFWFENSGKRRYFHPQHGAQFAVRVQGKTERSCGPGSQLTYSKARMRIDDIPLGSPICILTDVGCRGEIRIKAFDPKDTALTLEWTTWEK